MSNSGQENRGYTTGTTACPMTGAPFKPSARTGTHLRPIPSFDRRQLLMATGSLQLWQRTARLPAVLCVTTFWSFLREFSPF